MFLSTHALQFFIPELFSSYKLPTPFTSLNTRWQPDTLPSKTGPTALPIALRGANRQCSPLWNIAGKKSSSVPVSLETNNQRFPTPHPSSAPTGAPPSATLTVTRYPNLFPPSTSSYSPPFFLLLHLFGVWDRLMIFSQSERILHILKRLAAISENLVRGLPSPPPATLSSPCLPLPLFIGKPFAFPIVC